MAIRLHSRSGGTAARLADSRHIAVPAADNRRIAAAVVSAVAAVGVGRIAVAVVAADNRLADTALVAVVAGAVVEAAPLALGVGSSALAPRPLSPW